ncbi:deoxyuridine 5'-triphosphate nucleotidohydrolase [Buchnera aphidicola (Nipponaphis monzeni)]|uniref:Deoxyuridine 5'-triphosphate nucleotidohydrolase n=1 Tax=Buchnera aphidicola (Nipponaphis monzeni) TaxID=2495405 RepID=A0A455TAQ3_9GAMM|nr:dUTP diphosphatase [Buchnera aphidicola]BBI01427.1 deoxyuridine 5'-triphosphate nucleotidohydrolase [Buchnera aphidicola (Nipponaphis monzeni)]
MKNIDIKIIDSRIGKNFPFPTYFNKGAAGIDLCVCTTTNLYLKKNTTQLLPTGIAIFIKNPEISAIIIPRSGIGHKHGIILGNSIGLIDSDYQGEIMVSVWNRSDTIFCVKPGMRIAQIVFLPIIKVNFNIVTNFSLSCRGGKGFGHSGY